jgi:transposase
MKQQKLFESIPCDKYDLLSREDAIELAKGYADTIRQLQNKLEEQSKKLLSSEQVQFLLNEHIINIKNKLFGKSSEKSDKKSLANKPKKEPRKRVLLPSERYPNLDVIEKLVTLDKLPTCPCCSKQMKDSGLTEDSEYLTVIPRRYYVVQQKRVKYRCSSCQDQLITTPAIPRIKPGSSYSDEMVVDVTLSKYCDLIPVERYVQMAERGGVKGLPANTLIQGTHNLANFLMPVYKKIKDSACEYLVSDVFSGYNKAVSDSNIYRRENNLPEIKNIYCNAHARRKFKEAEQAFARESKLFLWCYQKIYHLEKRADFKARRHWQQLYYRVMERFALSIRNSYSSKSSLVKAINYFIKNYSELTYFLKREDIPIDNNSQERLMRSPVVGRKTWYGTHSKRGAQTNAVLFSLVESCKLNKVNPREYFKEIMHAIHEKRDVFTPHEYLAVKKVNPA